MTKELVGLAMCILLIVVLTLQFYYEQRDYYQDTMDWYFMPQERRGDD